MGNQVFAIKPIELQGLFAAWGWIDRGPSRHGGARFFEWRGHKTSVYGSGIARYEMGNAKAIKFASRMMGMTTKRFLQGPPEEAKASVSGIDLAALDRAQAQAAAHEQQKEQEMGGKGSGVWLKEGGRIEDKGYAEAVLRAMKTIGRKWVTAKEVHNHIVATGLDAPLNTVQGALSLYSRKETPPRRGGSELAFIERRNKDNQMGRGNLYRFNPNKFDKPVANEEPPAPVPAVVPPPKPVMPPTVEAVPVPVGNLNGSAPAMYEKLASLPNDRYLFQGDDGQLYIGSLKLLLV